MGTCNEHRVEPRHTTFGTKAMNSTEQATKLLESLQDNLQGLKACVRGENRHSVVCMLDKLQKAIEILNRSDVVD